MAHPFGSDAWIDGVWAQLRDDDAVRDAGATWAHGPLLLVVEPDEKSNWGETLYLRVDLHEGEARELRRADERAVRTTPFVLAATYPRWKQALLGTLDIVEGVLNATVSCKGDLPTLDRHRALLRAVLAAAARVETAYPDEVAAAAAPA